MIRDIIWLPILALAFFGSFARAHGDEIAVRSVIGSACSRNSDCGDSFHCIKDHETRKGAKFAGGYCVKFDCSSFSRCDVGSKCVEPEGTKFSVCLARCSSDTHCRNGYACHEDGVCLPAPR